MDKLMLRKFHVGEFYEHLSEHFNIYTERSVFTVSVSKSVNNFSLSQYIFKLYKLHKSAFSLLGG
jgi:hypothetical protein